MTNELEKQFFDTFGIEPKCQNTFINPSKCPFIESRECCDCMSSNSETKVLTESSRCADNPNCYHKQLLRKEQECERWKSNFNGKVSAIEELIQIIQQALKDFSIEVGTPQYDRLLNGAKSLGIEVKDYE